MNKKLQADFYSYTTALNDYQEEIMTFTPSFSTGVSVSTTTFKDRMNTGQKLEGEQLLMYARKNPNTMGVVSGDQVKILNNIARDQGESGATYVVKGIDQGHGKNEIVFFVDRLED